MFTHRQFMTERDKQLLGLIIGLPVLVVVIYFVSLL